MSKLLPYLLLCLLPFGLQAYESAHVIVVSHYGNDINGQSQKFVLFGLTKKGTLSTFGGYADRGENNPKHTAAREVEEEAIGTFGDRKAILKILEGVKPCSGSNSGHLSYVLPGKFYGDHLPEKFRQICFNPNKKLKYSQKEMVDIVSVSVDLIHKKIQQGERLQFQDNKGHLRPVRKGADGAIRAAVKAKLL